MEMNNWGKFVVGDVAAPSRNALVGGPFGSNLVSRDYVLDGVPVIRGQNMGLGKWVAGDFVFVSEEKAQELAANIARPGDLIFTQRGTLGQVAIVPFGKYDRYIVSQSQMKLTVDPDKADVHFLYYYFSSSEQQDYIRQNAIQTGVPHTNLTILRNTPLRLPLPEEQREIAGILGALDDKIELNRRINATLEATARALFQSWFVDFDPVRAKSEGRHPEGLDSETAVLFPDAFEDSALGLIPKGWRVEPLDKIAEYQNGLALQKFPPEGDEFLPVIKIRELRQGYVDENSDKASPNIRESCIVYDGDVLFSWSGSLLVDLWCGGMGALNQHLFKVTSETYPKWFFLYWTHYHLDDFVRVAADKATTMGHIQRHHLSSAYTVVPPVDVLTYIDQTMASLVDKMTQSRLESRKLAETRDTLLPLLMAGKLL
ncbi:MAG: restriction endonuclease subunit S [Anaerolineae bacterium]